MKSNELPDRQFNGCANAHHQDNQVGSTDHRQLETAREAKLRRAAKGFDRWIVDGYQRSKPSADEPERLEDIVTSDYHGNLSKGVVTGVERARRPLW